jgi:hypothetical protein
MLDRGGCSMPSPACFTPRKDLAPTAQEAGWAPGPVWMGAENLAPPTRIWSLERPTHSQSLSTAKLAHKRHIVQCTSRMSWYLCDNYSEIVDWFDGGILRKTMFKWWNNKVIFSFSKTISPPKLTICPRHLGTVPELRLTFQTHFVPFFFFFFLILSSW